MPEALARQVAAATEAVRALELYKPPGVAETIDWAMSLAALGRTNLDEHSVEVTLGTVLKYREDQERVRGHGVADIVRAARQARCLRLGGLSPQAGAEAERMAVAFARVLRGLGSTCPSGGPSTFAEALALTGVDRSQRRLLGGPDHAARAGPRTSPPTTGPSTPSGGGASRSPWPAAADPVELTIVLDTDDEDAAPTRTSRSRPRARRSSSAGAARKCCGTRTSPPTPTTSSKRPAG